MGDGKKLVEFETEYCADSVEWCPIEGHRHILVCGTYQLDAEERIGRLYLFSWLNQELSVLQKIDGSGILDSKWAHYLIGDKILLAAAKAEGTVSIYFLDDSCLNLLTEIKVEGLALSLDWSDGVFQCNNPKIVVSDSTGCVTLLQFSENSLEIVNVFKSHKFEAWITAFNYFNPKVIYSGSDDCKLNVYNIDESNCKPIKVDHSHHSGVTSLHSNHKKEFALASGSYDEVVKLWDTRNLKEVSRKEVGGGVWRVRWCPFGINLAVACMYGGFATLDEHLTKFNSFNEPHTSIAYGIDWSHEGEVIAACSFYDKKFSIQSVLLL